MPNHRDELCWTCIHESSCMTLDRPGRLVLECEEFSTRKLRIADRWQALTRLEPQWHRDPAAAETRSKAEGLCFDCENRPDCRLRRLDGGIWHCEEYR